MAKTVKTDIEFGCMHEFIPVIRERLCDRCPSEDVLIEILDVYTEELFKVMNKAMRSRYVEASRKSGSLQPTEFEKEDKPENKEE